MSVEIWDARDPADRQRWLAAHESWPTREVFAHPAYLELLGDPHHAPLAAFGTYPSGSVLYPFLLRPIDAAHLAPVGRSLADITSPYGYGGAFCTAVLDAADAEAFWRDFDLFCDEAHVVAEFTRLSLLDDQRLDPPGDMTSPLDNIVVDLRQTEEHTWRQYDHKVRKNVNKAIRSGITVEVDRVGKRLDDFLAVYTGTMERRDAGAGYYFPRTFFQHIIQAMPQRSLFFHACHNETVVSTELVLMSADTLYSFLGGTTASWYEARPNDLLKHEIIRWGRAHGAQRFVLGGGLTRGDGISRYKRSFAPRGVVPFKVARRVKDQNMYAELTRLHLAEGQRRDSGWQPDPSFFPAYRVTLPPTPAVPPQFASQSDVREAAVTS